MLLYIFQHRISRAFQKCPPFLFWTIRKMTMCQKVSGTCFVGHPVWFIICMNSTLNPGHDTWQMWKICKMSSSKKFGVLQCPQNSQIHDKGWPEICWFGLMESSNLDCKSSTHRPPSSIFNLQSSIFRREISENMFPCAACLQIFPGCILVTTYIQI